MNTKLIEEIVAYIENNPSNFSMRHFFMDKRGWTLDMIEDNLLYTFDSDHMNACVAGLAIILRREEALQIMSALYTDDYDRVEEHIANMLMDIDYGISRLLFYPTRWENQIYHATEFIGMTNEEIVLSMLKRALQDGSLDFVREYA